VNPYLVLGLENQIGYLHLKGSAIANPPPLGIGDTVMSTTIGDWYDAYTARIGAPDGHLMFYAKAGGVTTRIKSGVIDTVAPTTLNTTTTKTITGWAAGGGLEYAIDMHWSVKAEYLFLGLPPNMTNCGPQFIAVPRVPVIGPLATCSVTHTPGVQTITLGLNYRFR